MDSLVISRVLGIDPGYDRVGWCMLDPSHSTIQFSGCIETNNKASIYERYQQIDRELDQVIKKFHPTECGLENLFFQNNAKTAMKVSEARGVILSCLFRNHVEIFEYTPMQIKSAVTGNGHAVKSEIQRMIKVLTKCEKLPKLDDEVDAIATALCHAASRGVNRRVNARVNKRVPTSPSL